MANRVQPQVKPMARVNGQPVASVAKLARGHLAMANPVAKWIEAVASVATMLLSLAAVIILIRQG